MVQVTGQKGFYLVHDDVLDLLISASMQPQGQPESDHSRSVNGDETWRVCFSMAQVAGVAGGRILLQLLWLQSKLLLLL